ncbi:MAG: hypothetical protein BroJett018_27230 [Chloroflexota bacterium]|nr:MAG: hypothetical protein BroJett018_27230 [Chloroflexota bacterium]
MADHPKIAENVPETEDFVETFMEHWQQTQTSFQGIIEHLTRWLHLTENHPSDETTPIPVPPTDDLST